MGLNSLRIAFWSGPGSRPISAHVFLAIHAFFDPHAIRIYQRFIRVAEEGEGQAVIGNEFAVALHAIDAYAEELCFRLDLAPGITEITGLFRTAGCFILGVKIKNERRPL